MGADDSNDARGEPGACPGHEWVLSHLHLEVEGAQRWLVCRWCGTLTVDDGSGGLQVH